MASKGKNFLSGISVAIVMTVIEFVQDAYYAGRLPELFVSTPLLFGSWWLCSYCNLVWWSYLIPLALFCIYWHFLFQNEKITDKEANPNWANRDWWWKLDGWEFEEEAARVLRLNGYKTEVTKKTSDGGVDLILYKEGKKYIVQCKHYTSSVGVSVARELNGLRDDFRADGLILIASSGVTKSCQDFIKNKPYFKIWDLEDIIRRGLRPSSHIL